MLFDRGSHLAHSFSALRSAPEVKGPKRLQIDWSTSLDLHIEIGKISVRASLTKLDIGWRVLVLALVAFAGLMVLIFAG